MIQWWETPRPTARRPSQTAWTDRMCWARAMGCRGWTGTTAVPISMRDVSVADHGGGGEGVELVGDLRDPDGGQAGLLGPAGVGQEPLHLGPVAAPLGADHQADAHAWDPPWARTDREENILLFFVPC